MTFHDPIGRREGGQYLAWHQIGLSIRDMRDMREQAGETPRPPDSIRSYLIRHGYKPHPSQRGPKVDGRDTHCESDRHPGESVERKRSNNECPRCKVLRSAERRAETRDGLAERVEALRALGGEAATIGEWIAKHVRVA